MNMNMTTLLVPILLLLCTTTTQIYGHNKMDTHDNYYYPEADFGNSTPQNQLRTRRFLSATHLMTIPNLSVEYFWKTFVTRFFISQNMKNYDVTTWPGKFYTKGKYHFANEKNWLTALKKTFFLTPTKAEIDNYVFLATATQAAILDMSDRTATFLMEKYKKHIIDLELKEFIEPSGRFKRGRKAKQLKTYLAEMFLVDLDRKIIPQLREEAQREDFRNLIFEQLESENLLLLMNDLRLFEIEKVKTNDKSPSPTASPRPQQSSFTTRHSIDNFNDITIDIENEPPISPATAADQEVDKKWLHVWWEESGGETTQFGALVRLFKDLEKGPLHHIQQKLVVHRDGHFMVNTEYIEQYYLHGIRLVLEHVNNQAISNWSEYRASLSRLMPQQQQKRPQNEEGEIHEVLDDDVTPVNVEQQIADMEWIFLMSEFRNAVCFIFTDFSDSTTIDESEFSDLDETFFPGSEVVKERIQELEARLYKIQAEFSRRDEVSGERRMEEREHAVSFDAAISPTNELDKNFGALKNAVKTATSLEKDKNIEAERNGKNTEKKSKSMRQKMFSASKKTFQDLLRKAFRPDSSMREENKKMEGKEKEKTAPTVEKPAEDKKQKKIVDFAQPGSFSSAGVGSSSSSEEEAEFLKTVKNFNQLVLEVVDQCRYILHQSAADVDDWDEEAEKCIELLCNSYSIVQVNTHQIESSLHEKIINKICPDLLARKMAKDEKHRTQNTKERFKKIVQKMWQKTGQALFTNAVNKNFEEFVWTNCRKLELMVENDRKALIAKQQHFGQIMPILMEKAKQRRDRLERMIKRECLFKVQNLRQILKRFFRLETEDILTIVWPAEGREEESHQSEQHGAESNPRRRRFIVGMEFLVVLAMVEPIVETTILQQIFRQWNFYKWFNNCIRRSWRYKELRCKEPLAIQEEKQFASMLTTTVFEELTKEGVEHVCKLYEQYVEEHLMPLNQITIKYPSALLKELGIKMSNISKDLMDSRWRSINELPCLCRNSLDELRENWTNLVKNVREQKVNDAWANLAEFLTLTSKSQQQWIVATVICAPPAHASAADATRKNGTRMKKANNDANQQCLRRYLHEISNEADTQRQLKVRAMGTFKGISPNNEIVHLFELILMRRAEFFGYILANILKEESRSDNMQLLILLLFETGDWKFVNDFLHIYAEKRIGNKKNGWQAFISRELFSMAVNEKKPEYKFLLEIVRQRFERIMAQREINIDREEEEHKIDQLYQKCGEYNELYSLATISNKGDAESDKNKQTAGAVAQEIQSATEKEAKTTILPSQLSQDIDSLRKDIVVLLQQLIISFDLRSTTATANGKRGAGALHNLPVHCGNFFNMDETDKRAEEGKESDKMSARERLKMAAKRKAEQKARDKKRHNLINRNNSWIKWLGMCGTKSKAIFSGGAPFLGCFTRPNNDEGTKNGGGSRKSRHRDNAVPPYPLVKDLQWRQEITLLNKILSISGLLGEEEQHKFIARMLMDNVLDANFKEVRLLIANNLGLNFSKILARYEGGTEQANNEAGIWRIQGEKDGDELKKTFAKIYATMLKHFARNLGCIEEVEKAGEKMENYLNLTASIEKKQMDASVVKMQELIKALRAIQQATAAYTETRKPECKLEPTSRWIEEKFTELAKDGPDAQQTIDVLFAQPKSCLGIIADGFERILLEIVGHNRNMEMTIMSGGSEHHKWSESASSNVGESSAGKSTSSSSNTKDGAATNLYGVEEEIEEEETEFEPQLRRKKAKSEIMSEQETEMEEKDIPKKE